MIKTIDPNTLKAAAALALKEREAKTNPLLKYCPWTPTAKQQLLIDSPVKDTLYGGSAGGGKSIGLLMSALKYVHVPNYHAIIFRRTYTELRKPGALIPIANEWLANTDAKWSSQDNSWTFPSGATLSFGNVEFERDLGQYQSAAFSFIGVEEAGHWTEYNYKYLFSRCRSRSDGEVARVPLRFQATANPGNIGMAFLKDRYIDRQVPGRLFIPARYTENPHINQKEYEEMLDELDPITKAQLKEGLWITDSASLVYNLRDYNVIDSLPNVPRNSWKYALGIDLGWKDDSALTVLAFSADAPDIYVVHSSKHPKLTLTQVAEKIIELDRRYSFEVMVIDSAALQGVEEIRARYTLPLTPAKKQGKTEYIKLVNAQMESGNIFFLKGACDPLIKELREHVWKNDLHKDEHPNSPNHAADSFLYVWRHIKREYVPKRTLVEGSPEHTEAWIDDFIARKQEKYSEQELYKGWIND